MSKKQLIFTLATICITLYSFGQSKEEIILPKGGRNMSFYGTIEFYITKNQEVFNSNNRLQFYDDISNFILSKSTLPLPDRRVLLYADNAVKYSFIDKIKQEIALVEKALFLMTDNIDNPKKGYSIFLNSYLNKHKNIEIIHTLEQDTRNKEYNESATPPPFPPPNIWYHDFENTIYSGNKEEIIKALNKYSHDELVVSNNKTLKLKDKPIDEVSLIELFKQYEVLFLKFDYDILYEDYIHTIQEIKKVQQELYEKNEKKAYVIEVSFQLKKLFKNLKIDLSNNNS